MVTDDPQIDKITNEIFELEYKAISFKGKTNTNRSKEASDLCQSICVYDDSNTDWSQYYNCPATAGGILDTGNRMYNECHKEAHQRVSGECQGRCLSYYQIATNNRQDEKSVCQYNCNQEFDLAKTKYLESCFRQTQRGPFGVLFDDDYQEHDDCSWFIAPNADSPYMKKLLQNKDACISQC